MGKAGEDQFSAWDQENFEKALHDTFDSEVGVEELKEVNENEIKKFLEYYNQYRSSTAYIYEKRKNSGQELIRSSMLEGFFQLLFKDLVSEYSSNKDFVIGKAKSLVGFNFSPFSFNDAFKNINFNLLEKDQDFVIGIKLNLSIENYKDSNFEMVLPFVVIECKTYIEKNMLETHINSSSNIKKILPDCLYLLASEFMKMRSGEPHLSKLDNVYILCKETNSVREKNFKKNNPIKELSSELISELFFTVKEHLQNKWWDNESFTKKGRLLTN